MTERIVPGPLELADPPVVALLSSAKAAFVAEFNRRMARTAFGDLVLAYSTNVLRWLSSGPVRSADLVSCSGVSKQAISQQVSHLAASGYVRVTPHPDDGRARLVSLTPKGEAAQRTVHGLFAQIERDWETRLGSRQWRAFVATLGEMALRSADEGEPEHP